MKEIQITTIESCDICFYSADKKVTAAASRTLVIGKKHIQIELCEEHVLEVDGTLDAILKFGHTPDSEFLAKRPVSPRGPRKRPVIDGVQQRTRIDRPIDPDFIIDYELDPRGFYLCHICGDHFSSKRLGNFQRHIEKHHEAGEVTTFLHECNACDRKWKTAQSLSHHQGSKHKK